MPRWGPTVTLLLRVSDVRESSLPGRRRSGNRPGSGDLGLALNLDFEDPIRTSENADTPSFPIITIPTSI
jgi:hypothetical protein